MATQAAEKKETPPAKPGDGTPAANAPVTIKVSPAVAAARKVVDAVAAQAMKYIASGELHLPKDYSVNNALKSAWLVLQDVKDKDGRPALDVCTEASIANALLDMIVQGLNPMKKQNYFIVYGKTLACQRSYFGSMAIAERVNPKIVDWGQGVVYEGDNFKYGIKHGKKYVEEHIQEIGNVHKDKIIAAYCIAIDKNGESVRTEIMTIDEIHAAWSKSKTALDNNGAVKPGSTHGQFTADMAIKTVTNRNCKFIINSSSDNALLLERINRNEDLADRASVEAEIEEHANKGEALQIEGGIGEVLPPEESPITDEAPPEKTISGTVKCPDNGAMIARAGCPKCDKREGCPEYEGTGLFTEEKPEEKKTAKRKPGF